MRGVPSQNAHESGCEDGGNCDFLARFHLQFCHTDDGEQEDCDVADEVDGAGDVARR